MTPMAHMVIYDVWGMREMQILKSVREKNSRIKLPESRLIDAMRQWGLKMTFGASSRFYAVGEWMFEHREAFPTPLGVTRWWDDRSFTDPNRSPGPVPRYPLLSRCLPEPSGASNPRTHLAGMLAGTLVYPPGLCGLTLRSV